MQRRPLSALLVLAAVLVMHGLPVLTADDPIHHETVVTDGVDMGMSATSATVLVQGQFDGQADNFLSGRPPVAPEMPDHQTHAHLWAACLAVLLTGITLLAAVGCLSRGALPLLRGPTARPPWWSGWSQILRPPDLSALCLLRI